jgi:low temperature requirement protein LtrA
VYRFSAHRPDERLITNRLLVEVEHLRLAERFRLTVVIPFGNR